MMMMMINNITDSTYHNDAEVEYGPEAGEVFLEAESHPLKQHLNSEDDRVEDVHDVQDILQARLLIQIDVLKTLKQTRECIQYNTIDVLKTLQHTMQYNTIKYKMFFKPGFSSR